MRPKWRRYCCMNNNIEANDNMEIMEKACNNIASENEKYNSNCSCGFDDEVDNNVFPENPSLGQSYVPIQIMDETFKPCKGLKCGTLFPELVSPYRPGDSIKQIEFLENSNILGEGCNKCQ